ncbi:MAG TPA: nucleotide-binding protein, partial [Chloroflexota bacterium]|nr:nucleotide-binding protein [Chloroflexota bacterium]
LKRYVTYGEERETLYLTFEGYFAYASSAIPSFAEQVRQIERFIVRHVPTDNIVVYKEISQNPQVRPMNQAIADYIIEYLDHQGCISSEESHPSAEPGPLWEITNVADYLRKKSAQPWLMAPSDPSPTPRRMKSSGSSIISKQEAVNVTQEQVTRPQVFIASSGESVEMAHAILGRLEHKVDVKPWDIGVFQLSSTNIESLIAITKKMDFGVFVLTPDDIAKIRQKEYVAARDNVVFELGLFMGALGRDRCFMITPKGVNDFRLPTDLLGMVVAEYDPQRAKDDIDVSLVSPCRKILTAIKAKGPISRSRA